jgi:hypothetical protein
LILTCGLSISAPMIGNRNFNKSVAVYIARITQTRSAEHGFYRGVLIRLRNYLAVIAKIEFSVWTAYKFQGNDLSITFTSKLYGGALKGAAD